MEANSVCCQTLTPAQSSQQRMLPGTHLSTGRPTARASRHSPYRLHYCAALRWLGVLPAALVGRTPRPHRAHSRYLCKLRDQAHSQSYAAVFQLYAISGWAHSRHRPMQLQAVHWGLAHSQAFGGNVSAFNANTTLQASTWFARLVLPHGYCCYPPKIRKKYICLGSPPAYRYVRLLCCICCSRGCYEKARGERRRERARSETTKPSCHAVGPVHLLSRAARLAALVNPPVLLLPLPRPSAGCVCSVIFRS